MNYKSTKISLCKLVIFAITTLLLAPSYAKSPVKIYLLVGQSNMQGKGPINGTKSNSLKSLVTDAKTKDEFSFAVESNGEWRARKDVWIYYNLAPWRELRYGLLTPGYGTRSGQIGPEFGFGHIMGDALDDQILIIKAAWGGKSLGHNFLSPSIGKYSKPKLSMEIAGKEFGSNADKTSGYYYYQTLEFAKHVTSNMKKYFPKYKGEGFEFAGLCWHQGFNDQFGGLEYQYEKNLVAFIKDIRSSEHGLGIPDLPIVIATSGMIKESSPIVKAQLAMANKSKYPEFIGNVSVVDTHQPYGPDKMKFLFGKKYHYHWNNHARSYTNIGRAMASEMLKLQKK